MSFGFQVFSNSGQKVVDVQNRLFRLHSIHQVTQVDPYSEPSSGFVSVPGMARDGKWFIAAGDVGVFQYLHCTAAANGFNWIIVSAAGNTAFDCTVSVFII
jgi:hypothetical protein